MQPQGQTVQRSAFLLLSMCAGLAGVGLVCHEYHSAQTRPAPLIHRINPNTASLGQLQTLPGIGPARAQAIVQHREAHLASPAFTCLEDLHRVHGLGPALVSDMAAWLDLGEPAAK